MRMPALDNKREQLRLLVEQIAQLDAEHSDRKFPDGVRELWNGLNADRETIAAEVAELEKRHKRMRELVGNPGATERAGSTGHGAIGPVRGIAGGGLPLPADLADPELRSLFEAVRSRTSLRVEARSDITGVAGTQVTTLQGGDYVDMPRVASLFRTERVLSPVVRTYRTSAPATAGVVAEGVAKPDSGLAITPVDVTMQKLATWTRVSAELLADFGSFVNVIRTELTRAVVAEENAQLTGTLLAAPGLGTGTGTGDGIDAAADAIAGLQAQGIAPDAIVVSPGRLATIRKAQAANGSYVVDPLTAGPQQLHGLRVVPTPELADAELLVGAFADAGIVYVRESVSVLTGYTGDDFRENMVSLVAEERLALAVTQPARVVNVTMTA